MSEASEASGASGRHLPALDGLRGLAVLLVVAFHASKACPPVDAASRAYAAVAEWGWAGVDLFFVLSGFLITGILVDARESPGYFSSFYARRTLRIVPLYYVALVVLLLLGPQVGLTEQGLSADLDRSFSAWVWVYGLNFKIAFTEAWSAAPDQVNHFWSLAVEEQFYLLWPFLVWLLPRRRLGALCLAAIALGLGYRSLLVWRGQLNAALVLMPCRLDALGLGALLAVLLRSPLGPPPLLGRLSLPVLLVAASALVGLRLWRGTFGALDPVVASLGFLLHALLFGALLVRLLRPRSLLTRAFEVRGLRELGKLSYALYVVHHPLVLLMASKGLPERLGRLAGGLGSALSFFALALGGSVLLSLLSWHLLERPLLEQKKRFPYLAPPGPPPEPPPGTPTASPGRNLTP